MTAILNFLFSSHIEVYTTAVNETDCLLYMWHFNAFGDLLRTVGFMSVVWYLTRKSSEYFPLPFTWIFKDLSKFIFDTTCVRVFRDYLEAKEPNRSFLNLSQSFNFWRRL